ncbi:hypothetical protein [Acinetobacter sp. YH01009]|uniref:hypothetical protein n=1 Tax=Acinetobacter TaxID=469 RepID=UPI0015D33596
MEAVVENLDITLVQNSSTFVPEVFLHSVNYFCQTLENTFHFDKKALHFFESGNPKEYGLYLTEQHSLLFLNSCSNKFNADNKTATIFTAFVLLNQKNNESTMLDLTLNDPKRVESHFKAISKDQTNAYLKNVHDLTTYLKSKYSDSGILKDIVTDEGFSKTLKPLDLQKCLKEEVELINTLMCLVSTQFIYVSTAILLKRPILKDFLKLCLTNKKYILQYGEEWYYDSIYNFAKRIYELKHLIVTVYLRSEAVVKDVVVLCELASKKH